MKYLLARLTKSVFCLYLALNMTVAAIVCFPVVRERETVSGIVGRYALAGNRLACFLRVIIDFLHRHELDHCVNTYLDEDEVRQMWYE